MNLVRRVWKRSWKVRVSAFVLAVLLVMALLAPFIAPHDPNELGSDFLAGPSGKHLMGTDHLGRDVLSRFLFGARTSLIVAAIAVTGALVTGALIGAVGGWRFDTAVDQLLMRAMDVILSFPLLILVPAVSGILIARSIEDPTAWTLPSILLVSFAIAFVEIPSFARLTRGLVMAESKNEYVDAARSYGMNPLTILWREIRPNIVASLIVQAAFCAAIAIMVEAAVSFLGFGVQPPTSSWGLSLADGRSHVALGAWWLVVFPSVGIIATVVSINVIGDELRDELDPNLEGAVDHSVA